jgi:hypothetical protein
MKSVSAPLAIDLPASLNEKIEAIRAAHALHSASAGRSCRRNLQTM